MWAVGMGAILLLSAMSVQPLGWRRRDTPVRVPWDVVHVASTYTPIAGGLAGISVTSAVFLANLAALGRSNELAPVVGIFLIAFVTYLGTTLIFATIPGPAGPEQGGGSARSQGLLFVLGNITFFVGILMTILALRPLLLAVGLLALADIFTWLLLFTVIAGVLRIGLFVHVLLEVAGRAYAAMPIIAIAAAVAYRYAICALVPSLWPAALDAGRSAALEAMLMVTVVCFVSAAGAFVAQSLLLSLYGDAAVERLILRFGHRVMLGYAQLVSTSIALLWVATAAI